MGSIWRGLAVVGALSLTLGACGSGSSDTAKSDERIVLVDSRHDQFSSAFFTYFPKKVQIAQGGAVRFEQTWNGEPHSVTMGKVVDKMFEFEPLFEKYPTEEAARADGVSEETITEIKSFVLKLPPMVAGDELYQPGAQPCYVEDLATLPDFFTGDDTIVEGAACPTAGQPQPAFNGRQALYNSGFIAAEGKHANEFVLPIADDAEPGTYRYFCNYHWTSMSGDVEVVAKGVAVPSQRQVSRRAREQLDADARPVLPKVKRAERVKSGGRIGQFQAPLAGYNDDFEQGISVNEFFPADLRAKVGEKVTWTIDGYIHTVSFNVPKYFPIYTVDPKGVVERNPRSHEAVGFEVPERPSPRGPGDDPPPLAVDVGAWDGRGGFRSSGSLNPGDTFSVTFTKPGTYPYACVLHPQMVGTLVVRS